MGFDPVLATQPYAYLTTTGRRTGRPREVELWFALADDGATVILMTEVPTQWYRNLRARPACSVRIAATTLAGHAELPAPGSDAEASARAAMVAKHGDDVPSGDPWREAGLPVLVRLGRHGAVRGGTLDRVARDG